MRLETKVGLFTLVGLILLTIGIVWKSNLLMRTSGYMIVGSFQTVNGLLSGAEVRYRGYIIGYVSRVVPDPKSIKVYMFIRRKIKISEGSRLRVDFDGLIGEKYINVIPNPNSDNYLKHGAMLPGTAASGLVDFVHTGTRNLEETKKILEVLREIITSKESQTSLQELIINLNRIAERTESVMTKVDSLLQVENVKTLGHNIDTIFDEISLILTNVNSLILNLNDSISEQDVHSIVKNLQSFTAELDDLTRSFKGEKDSIMEDIRPILEGTKEIVERAGKVSKTIGKSTSFLDQTAVNIGAEVFQDSSFEVGSKIQSGESVMNIDLGNATSNIRVKDLTFGRRLLNNLSAAVGLVNYEPGIQIDYLPDERFLLENSIFNPDNLTYLLKANYFIVPHIRAIFGYQQNANQNSYTFGIGFSSK